MKPDSREERSPSLSAMEEAKDRLWGGRGNGESCAHCEQPIDGTQMQLELERPGGVPVLRFHVHCYDAWRAGAD